MTGGRHPAARPRDAGAQRSVAQRGSYWSGLKLIPLDKATGKPRPGDKTMYSIAYRPAPEGGDNPVEGAFIFQRDG